MAKYLTVTALVSALLLPAGAYALDVENQDSQEHVVTWAAGDGGPATFKLKPGEIKRDVCGSGEVCNLMIDDKTREFVGGVDELVVIKNRKLHIGKPRG